MTNGTWSQRHTEHTSKVIRLAKYCSKVRRKANGDTNCKLNVLVKPLIKSALASAEARTFSRGGRSKFERRNKEPETDGTYIKSK